MILNLLELLLAAEADPIGFPLDTIGICELADAWYWLGS